MDCSPPGSSVHGILQARVLEWVAIAFKITKETKIKWIYTEHRFISGSRRAGLRSTGRWGHRPILPSPSYGFLSLLSSTWAGVEASSLTYPPFPVPWYTVGEKGEWSPWGAKASSFGGPGLTPAGAGFHRPSLLCSLLSSSFCFSPSPFLSFELSLVSISRKLWPQKMSWEMCPLFSGKKRLCKIVVNSSLFSRILALKSSY